MRRALAGLAVLTVTALLAIMLGLLLAGVAHAQASNVLYQGQPVCIDGFLRIDATTGLPTIHYFKDGTELLREVADTNLWLLTSPDGSVVPLSIAITPNATLAVTDNAPFYGTSMVLAHPSIAPVSDTHGIGYPMGYSGPQFGFGGGFTGNCNFEDANGNDALEPAGTPGEACFATRLNWIAGRCVEFNSFGQLVPAADACGSGSGVSALDELDAGTPADGQYTDGLFQWIASTNAADSLDDVNELLPYLADPPPLSLAGATLFMESAVTCSASSGHRASAGTGQNFKSAAGEAMSTYSGCGLALSDNFTLRGPEVGATESGVPADDAFSNGREGTLGVIIQRGGSSTTSGTIDLTAAGCTGTTGCPVTNTGADAGAMRLNGQHDGYNSFPPWVRGDFTIDPDAATALAQGYNKITARHVVGSNRDSAGFEVFVDTSSTVATFTGACTVNEQSSATKFLSGVEMYSGSATWNVSATVTNLFANTYNSADAFTYTASSGGWTSGGTAVVDPPEASWNGTVSNPPNLSNTATLGGATKETFTTASNVAMSNARLTCTARKPLRSDVTSQSASQNRMIHSWGTTSTGGAEPWQDENRRLPCDTSESGCTSCTWPPDPDCHNTTSLTLTGQWTSTADLGSTDLQVFMADVSNRGALQYPASNYGSGFLPSSGQPNYSGHTGDHWTFRGFEHTAGTPRSNAVIRLYGITTADLVAESSTTENKIKVLYRLPTQTQWADALAAFNAGDPSPLQTFGEGGSDEALRTGSDGNGSFVDIPVTFGGFSTASSGSRIYVVVYFEDTNAPRPTQKNTRLELRDKAGAGATGGVWS